MKCNRPLSALRFTSSECHNRQPLNPCFRQHLRFFEHGDKARKLLVHHLKNPSSSHLIPQIETSSGGTTDSVKSQKVFEEYFVSLQNPSLSKL